MTYLIIDTETNGLPQSYDLPPTDLTNWPRLIAAAWGLYDEQGRAISQHYTLVKPDGYRWNRVAQRIHGLSEEQALTDGKPLIDVLKCLRESIEKADVLVGHNIDLDYGVIGAEFVRVGDAVAGSFPVRPVVCTMDASAEITPDRKPVRLDDLYKLLTGRPMKGLHNATADMLATARCFFELKRRHVITH